MVRARPVSLLGLRFFITYSFRVKNAIDDYGPQRVKKQFIGLAALGVYTYRETCVSSPVEHGTSLQKLTAAIISQEMHMITSNVFNFIRQRSRSGTHNRVRRYYGRLLMCKRTMYKRARIPMFLWERPACANSGAQPFFLAPAKNGPRKEAARASYR